MRTETEIRRLRTLVEESAEAVLPILNGPSSCTRMAMAGVLAALDAALSAQDEGALVEVAVAAIGRRLEALDRIEASA
jgi:hypothetical protein